MSQNPEEREFKSGFTVSSDTPEGHKSWSGAVEAMVRNLKLVKLWGWLNKNDPNAAKTLANYQKVEKALRAMDDGDKIEQDIKEEAFHALGVKLRGEEEIKNRNLRVIDLLKDEDQNDAIIEYDGEEKTVEEWLTSLRGVADPDHALVEKIESQIGIVFDKIKPNELKGVDDGRALGELEDKIQSLSIMREIKEAGAQGRLTGQKTAVGRNFDKEIKNNGELWRVKNASQSEKTRLETLATRVREDSLDVLDEGHMKTLSVEQIIKRLDNVNELRDKITSMLDHSMNEDDAVKLRNMLHAIQAQYEEAAAKKIVKEWRKGNRSEEWSDDIAAISIKEVLGKKRSMWSVRIKWKGASDSDRWKEVSAATEKEAGKLVDKLRKKGIKLGGDKAEVQNEPSNQQFESMKKFKETEQELINILGKGNKYNLFEDTEFWSDLAIGDKGIEKIIKRASPHDKDGLKKILEKMRQGKEVANFASMLRPDYGLDGLDGRVDHSGFGEQLGKLIKDGKYGAAANLMLEYTTRVGIRESNQDLQFMMIKRDFLAKIAEVSPDFKEQFEMNQMLGYLPGLSSQKIEEFYGSYMRLHSKGNLDIIEGENAMMGGNQIEHDGKTTTFSVKTFAAVLRNPRYMVRVLKADPNTLDSTLQGIVIEEMYGRGAKMKVKKVDGKDKLFLALPGQTDESLWRSLDSIKVNMRFADLGVTGFNGWSDKDLEKDISLEKVLNRNQWILRDGMTMMWYSEDWKHVIPAKTYQTAILQAAPKALLTSAVAKAAYQGQFENIASPMMETFEVLTGSLVSGMSVFKMEDMVKKNVATRLWKELGNDDLDEKEARLLQDEFAGIGQIFMDLHVRNRIVDVGGGRKAKFKNRIRMNDTVRLAFNNWTENDGRVVQMLRERFEDMDMKRIPSENELIEYYKRWKDAGGEGFLPSPSLKADGTIETREDLIKIAYFGQEYGTLWQEINELKMDKKANEIWEKMSFDELQVLWKMNDMMFGKPRDRLFVIDPGQSPEQALREYKQAFLDEMYIDAFVNRTFTNNGDDHEQYAMKYAPARDEAWKVFMKLANVTGPLTDLDAFSEQLQLFLPYEEKCDTIALVGNRLNRATTDNRLYSYKIPLTASRRHEKDHPSWQFWKSHDHTMRSTGKIEWITYKDIDGRVYFATTANGDRAYEIEEYGGKGLNVLDSGNWSKQERDIDLYRPVDFEIYCANLGVKGILDKHSVHLMVERMLGTHQGVEKVFGKYLEKTGMSPKAQHKAIEMISGFSTKAKLLAMKLFFVNDPKYAFWTLTHDVVGFTGKAFEQIFGISVGGGGGHGH